MTGIGPSDLRRHLAGETLTLSQAVRAKCCDCMAGYVDGRESCTVPSCPLWPFMPYNEARRHFRHTKSQADMIGPVEGDMGGLVALEAMP